jgi:hypothetical protein
MFVTEPGLGSSGSSEALRDFKKSRDFHFSPLVSFHLWTNKV